MEEGMEMSVLDGLGGMDTFTSNGSMAFANFNCLWLNLYLEREAKA